MDSTEESSTVLIYNIPFQNEAKCKVQLIDSLSRIIKLTQKDIILQKKDNKFSAYLTVSSQKCKQLTALKELTFQKNVAPIRKYFSDHQIFINKLPDIISIQEAQQYFEQFGKIVRIEEQAIPQHLNEGVIKIKARHCYIKFDKDDDAEKCLMLSKAHLVKKEDLKVVRNYKICENEDTDKKIFLKITPPVLDAAPLQEKLNNIFKKFGNLREKIRVEGNSNSSKAIVIFTNGKAADQALKEMKDKKIDEKFEIFVRPFANKESHFVYIGGVRLDIPIETIESELSRYGPLVSCTVQQSKKGVGSSVIAAFTNEESFKRLLAEYREDKDLLKIFIGAPYVTIHMSAKQRKDYSAFMNGINDKNKHKFNDKPNPIGAGLIGGPYPFQKNFIPPPMYPPMFAPNGFAQNGFTTTNQPPSFQPPTKTAFN